MSVRLFVGNLSYDVTETELRELFAEAGTVTQVRIPLDRESGRPRGFAFIDLGEREHGDEAVRRFDQHVFKGRALGVSEATPREEGSRGPSRSPGGAGPSPPSREGSEAPARRARTFGEDAAPRARRKPGRWATKGPKGPLKESGGEEHSFSGHLEPDDDDAAFDDRPFWEIAESEDLNH